MHYVTMMKKKWYTKATDVDILQSSFSAFKEIVEKDTFFGRLREGWLEKGFKEEVAGYIRYFLFIAFYCVEMVVSLNF